MTCREKFLMDHPGADLERAVLETCPQDHGITIKGKLPCLAGTVSTQVDCRACWEQEAEE